MRYVSWILVNCHTMADHGRREFWENFTLNRQMWSNCIQNQNCNWYLPITARQCSLLFFGNSRSEGWPHHGRTFSIYLCPLTFWLIQCTVSITLRVASCRVSWRHFSLLTASLLLDQSPSNPASSSSSSSSLSAYSMIQTSVMATAVLKWPDENTLQGTNHTYEIADNFRADNLPSVLWRRWLGDRKGIRPEKIWSDEVLAWLSVCNEVQTICIWFDWCHCHPVISCFSKIQNGLSFWYRPTQVVLEKRPLNDCVCCVCFVQITW